MSYAKKRWWDENLLEVFAREFVAYPRPYYINAIAEGKITVNGKKVSTEYQIKNGDAIIHHKIRTETPVFNTPIEIIHEDDSLIVVNKPPSMPVHPCGNFKYNTLSEIMRLEMGYQDLKPAHRLDRQTSGIVFFARTNTEAEKFRIRFTEDKETRKVYFARVRGKMEIGKTFSRKDFIYCIAYKDNIYDSREKFEDISEEN